MKLMTLGVVAALAIGSVALANAMPVNLITNGTFSAASAPYGQTPTQFGTASSNGYTSTQFITGWTGNDGYEIWYNNATDASNTEAHSQWGIGGSNTGKEKLYGPVAPPPNGAVSFVGLDGDQTAGVQSSIGQMLTGLTIGKTYTVSFDWATSQMQSKSGPITEYLRVNFNSAWLDTSTVAQPGEQSTAWLSTSMNFVADSTSAFLNFLSVGTPSSLPPMALLSNVSVTQSVPEPPVLAMFGLGLLGLGVATMAARRRAQRRIDMDHDGEAA